jgi:signal peptidase I
MRRSPDGTFGQEEVDMTQPASLNGDNFQIASKKAKESGARGTVRLVVLVASALLALVGVRAFLFEPFSIPSGSLIPSLLIGDYVFVSKYSYGYSHFSLPSFLDLAPGAMPGRLFAALPKRGDMVVFKLPRDGRTDYIKRVIGLPGDKVQMVGGRLFINGAIVERVPLPPYRLSDPSGRAIDAPHYEEILPEGAKHDIIQLEGDAGHLANTAVFEVPPGSFFVMGDNRDNSLDSRIPSGQGGVGYVPFDNLIGRAEVIFYSVEDAQLREDGGDWLSFVRWRRLFQPVR